ncbi:MAG: RagB/SusD family nutrient uptake outer membrane protein [Parabacteroides sp.]|nr:RagB/SusD family nutrient uptake outer membrane protein [Parabacteroides sp.]
MAYSNLFLNYNLSASPEIILFKDYDKEAFIMHAAGRECFSFVTNLSQSLMDSYLLIKDNRAIPFTSLPDYNKTEFVDIFKDRDPRLSQTFMIPGYIRPGESAAFRPNLNLGGYPQIKFVPDDIDQTAVWGTSYNDLPLARYGEILLIYAEAKAELGTITQNDIDKTVNMIRDRVSVPGLLIGEVAVDPVLAGQYPNVSGKNKALILEIRRERRVELACEGFRSDDLCRWKAGHLLEQSQQGMYIPRLGLFDCTGDGIPDIGVYENEASNDIPLEERGKYTFYYLNSEGGTLGSIYLSEGNSGHVMSTSDVTGVREFIEPKYYYYPLPQTQRALNPNLEETIFWRE